MRRYYNFHADNDLNMILIITTKLMRNVALAINCCLLLLLTRGNLKIN